MTQRLKTFRSGLIAVELTQTVDTVMVDDVQRLLECSRASAYRMIATLVEGGYLLKAKNHAGYVAGEILLTNFDARVLGSASRPLIRTFLRELRELTEASAHCSILIGAHAFALDGYRSLVDSGMGGRVGMNAPAHVMAAGKLLLSQLDSAQVSALFPGDSLPEWRNSTITTRSMLEAELEVVRAAGYAVANEESEANIISVALPFTGYNWRNRSALVLSRSRSDKTLAELLEVLPMVKPLLANFLQWHDKIVRARLNSKGHDEHL